MITIKIRDTQWFEKCCKELLINDETIPILKPKYSPWERVTDVIHWISSDAFNMSLLEDQALEVIYDSGVLYGNMPDARYFAGGYWIPNWAIEWVKEE